MPCRKPGELGPGISALQFICCIPTWLGTKAAHVYRRTFAVLMVLATKGSLSKPLNPCHKPVY
eukprot:571380-Pelagomonas_calceolata.AAC.1